jgi:hypothetical protein
VTLAFSSPADFGRIPRCKEHDEGLNSHVIYSAWAHLRRFPGGDQRWAGNGMQNRKTNILIPSSVFHLVVVVRVTRVKRRSES